MSFSEEPKQRQAASEGNFPNGKAFSDQGILLQETMLVIIYKTIIEFIIHINLCA